MAVLRDYIDALDKVPTATVRVNGVARKDIISVDAQYELGSTINQATIRVLNDNSLVPEDRIVTTQGYNGKEAVTFTGLVDSIQKDEFEETYTIVCRDLLKKAMDTFLVQEIAFGQDVEKQLFYYSTFSTISGGTFVQHIYNSLTDLTNNHPETAGNYSTQGVFAHAVVQWMLVMCGLQEGTEIAVEDTNYYLADITPAFFHLTSIYDAIQQICDLIGWYIFCDVGGVVRFRKKPRNPTGYTSWTYSDKGNTKNIHRINHSATNTDLRNYVEIHGASGILYVARADSPYLGTTPYRGVVIGNEFIDTPDIAKFVGDRVLTDLNRLKETVQVEADGNPYLFPGQSVTIKSRVASSTYMLQSVSHSESADAGFKTSFTAVTYPGDTNEEDDPFIEANFTPLTVMSIGDPKIIALMDGAASYSNRGIIEQYDWTLPDATFISSPDSQVWMVFDKAEITNGNHKDVTLTVYDDLGFSDTLVSGITLSGLLANGIQLMYRQLYGAMTSHAVGSQTGGEVWNVYNIPAVSVAASNFAAGGVYVPSGHALFGTSDGHIWRTSDFCITCIDKFDTEDGVVNHVHIPELFSNFALAGTAGGSLFQSVDSGETWEKLYEFDDPIIEARYSYLDTTYIMVVCSGRGKVFESFDTGAHFSSMPHLDESVRWNDAGSATNYFAHTSGIIATSGQYEFYQVPFSGGATPYIPALTVAIDDDSGIWCVDITGQHWINASGQMTMTQDNADNKTRHMLRDGEAPMLGYYATVSGIDKTLDRNKTIGALYRPTGYSLPASPNDSVPSAGFGEMVAYGPLAPIIPPTIGGLVMNATDTFDYLGNRHSGLFIALKDNSGWVHLPDTENFDPAFNAFTTEAGAIAWVSTTDGEHMYISRVRMIPPASGVFASGIIAPSGEHHIFIPPDLQGNEGVFWIRFSRKVGASRLNYMMLGEGVPFASSLKHFSVDGFLSPSPTITFQTSFLPIQGASGGLMYTSEMSNTDRVYFKHEQGLLSLTHRHFIWNCNDGTYDLYARSNDAYVSNLSEWIQPMGYAKYPQQWRMLGIEFGTGDADLVVGPNKLEATGLTGTEQFTYASMETMGDTYYVDGLEVFRHGKYTQGSFKQLIYTAASGTNRISHMYVTHNRAMNRDYIALNLFVNDDLTHTVYSLDGGDSWTNGPDAVPVNGNVNWTFWVDQ